MDFARQVADEAIAHLSEVPRDLISQALERFADQVVKRTN